MADPISIDAVLMAGGSSQRFGGNKLLAHWQGRPLVCSLLERFPHKAFGRTVVVTRHPEVAALAGDLGYEVLLRPEECQDISGTIRAGLAAVQGGSGCLFAVCDQPLLSPPSVLRLAEHFQSHPHRIAALSYDGRRGNPVIFPASLYGELLTLPPGGSGGRVIKTHPQLLDLVEADFPEELLDVDTREDLQNL